MHDKGRVYLSSETVTNGEARKKARIVTARFLVPRTYGAAGPLREEALERLNEQLFNANGDSRLTRKRGEKRSREFSRTRWQVAKQ